MTTNKSRSKIIQLIKTIDPTFKSKRTDTYASLMVKFDETKIRQQFINDMATRPPLKFNAKNLANVKLTNVKALQSKIRDFINDPVDNKQIEINAQDLINNIQNFYEKEGFYLLIGDEESGEWTVVRDFDVLKSIAQLHKEGGYYEKGEEQQGSDTITVTYFVKLNKKIKVIWQKDNSKYKSTAGAYFTYYNNTEFDLKRYQIFSKTDYFKETKLPRELDVIDSLMKPVNLLESVKTKTVILGRELEKENCLMFALLLAGVSKQKISDLKHEIFTKDIKSRDLSKIADLLDIEITFRRDDKHSHVYNRCGKMKVSIALFEGHYFLNEQTKITSYTLDNYELCLGKKNWPGCRNSKGKVSKFLDSYTLIKRMFESEQVVHTKPFTKNDQEYPSLTVKMFTPITMKNLANHGTIENIKESFKLKNPEYEGKDYGFYADKKAEEKFIDKHKPHGRVIYFDTETFYDDKLGYHRPYCLCAIEHKYDIDIFDSKKEFYGLDCVKQFFDTISGPVTLIAHNLAFDFRQVIGPLSKILSIIETGKSIKCVKAEYNGHKIIFKDSMAFLNCALAKIPSTMGIESGEKDSYPYTLINSSNFDAMIHIDECFKHVKDQAIFLNAVTKAACIEDGFVNIKKYTLIYCHQDVRILSMGFSLLRSQFKQVCRDQDIFELDIYKLISLPSFADYFMRFTGCYNDCKSFYGQAQQFIRECCVGGRVMTNNNEKYHVKYENGKTFINGVETNDPINSGTIDDFDGVSLYPSGMSQLPGLPMGYPNTLDNKQCKNFNEIKSAFIAYYVEVKILKIGIKRAFPLQSIKINGVRNFTNDLVGKTIFMDNIALEDFIEFQKAEVKILRGYYYDDNAEDGLNKQMSIIIPKVFNLRRDLKRAGNPLQNVYKLIMNSSYGKLCQKAITHTKKFIAKDDIRAFIDRNHKFIVKYSKVNEALYVVTLKNSIVRHDTPCHLASLILSQSKRIMNRVMCLAEDIGLMIFYQDTDSMHIFSKAVPILSIAYKEKYGQDLVGEDLGQFHTDFSVSERGAKNIRAVESYFLGKKCYVDRLEYEVGDDTKHDYHIRVKGVPSKAMEEISENPLETYKRLYDGESVKFNLEKHIILQMDPDYHVRPNTKLKHRSLQFK